VLGVRERDFPPGLRARILRLKDKTDCVGVEEGARQLGAVEMSDISTGKVDIDDVIDSIAPKFGATFTALLSVMEVQERKQLAKEAKPANQARSMVASSGSTIIPKRPSPSPTSIGPPPAKRSKSAYDPPSPSHQPRTPDQPTNPSNPNLTSSTICSTDESHTQKLLYQLIMNTLGTLRSEFRTIAWQRSGYKVELTQTYLSSLPYN
jgi:hypothetical protein